MTIQAAQGDLFYHVTALANLKSIQANGLVPSIGPRSGKLDEKAGIFLWSSQDEMEDGVCNWLSDEFHDDEDLVCLVLCLSAEVRRQPDPAMSTILISLDRIAPKYIVDFFDI